jgi:transcriptional regulator with XRE-family HTH domain
MSHRTEFGRSCQSAREVRGLSLLSFAKLIGVSPSFVCAIETGEKSAPDTYVEKAVQVLGLDQRASSRLKERELRSRHTFRIEDVKPAEARLLAAFIENRHQLTEQDLQAATQKLQLTFDFQGG